MNLEQKIELLFGTVILGGLGFLVVNQFDMKGTLSTVSAKIETTDRRVSRIAETLPDLKARVAWEEINYPLAGFVTTSIPRRTVKNKWATEVKVYDTRSGKLKSWTITLDKNHKDFIAYVVAGKIRSDNPYNASFAELAYYSSKEKEPVSVPAAINAHTSFVIRSGDVDEYSTYVSKIAEKEPKVRPVGLLKSWKEVAEKLNDVK